MKLLVLINEAARGLARTDRKELSVRLLRGFNGAGAEAYVHCIDAPSLLREAKEAAGASTSDFDAVIIGGGDGLVAEVINYVAATYKPIGVLPLGIHNHFARQLNVPLELDRAVTALARGEIGDAPAGEVNGRIFLNFAAVGLPGTSPANQNGTWPAMLKRVVNMNDRPLCLRSRGHALVRDGQIVIACNNAHAMSMFGEVVPAAAAPEAGLMNVYVARASRRRGPVGRVLKRVGTAIWNGPPPPLPRFQTMALPELRIESSRKQLEVSIDGDVWAMRPPLSIQLRERAVRVLLPGDPTPPPPPPPAPRPAVEVMTHVQGLELEPEPRDTPL